jgi:hypothetical protein
VGVWAKTPTGMRVIAIKPAKMVHFTRDILLLFMRTPLRCTGVEGVWAMGRVANVK